MNKKTDHRRQEVQQIVKNACDQLNSEGVDARNYVEQLAWLFFLKAFDEAETSKEAEAGFDDKTYERRLSGEFAWSSWAKNTDHPDDMLEFVDGKLWIKLTSPDPKKGLGDDALAQRFRRIFDNVRNYSRRGVSFAKVVAQVDKLHFSDQTDVIVLSEIYEDLLKRVAADSAGYAGEFYTQRHLIRAMVEVVQPKAGETVYDPCFGTAGFLGEAADYIRRHGNLSGKQLDDLQHKTFFGLELKPLTYLLGSMNMILHGIEGANLELSNTLEVHSQNVAEKDKRKVILANPPYGGKMAQEMQTNFRVRSGATECLFLQHIMANLAKGGRAAVVVPEGVLYRGGADQKVRKELLEQFNVHTVLSLPAGCFLPYTGVKTNVIFFDKPEDGSGTTSVWFYDLTNDGFDLKQTRKPINGNQLPDFLDKWRSRPDGDNSWTLDISQIASKEYSLSAKNPNKQDDYEHLPALAIVESKKEKVEQVSLLLAELEALLVDEIETTVWAERPMEEIAEINPRRPRELVELPDDHLVTFVPMAAVSQVTGSIEAGEIRPFGTVRKGFTYFAEGDVIFAKITPCMQNGKSAIARGLANGLGFGSTEFHVIRPDLAHVLPEWIWHFVRQGTYRREGMHQFRGAVGQQRVPPEYLGKARIPLPSVSEQRRIIGRVDECLSRVQRIEELQRQLVGQPVQLEPLREAILRKAFAAEL